jgi:hypothetical protein
MEYTITRTKRNSIILCSSFLILYVLITRLLFRINTPTKIDTLEQLIRNVIYLIPFGYLMLVFNNYFKHYKLKVLQISILIIFIMEVILRSTFLTNLLELTLKKAVLLSASTIWIAATIVLIVVLFKNKSKIYPGTLSIRNYAISSLLIYVFSTTYSFYLKPVNPINTMLLVGLTSAIPFIFTIVFAIKLNLKE